MCAPAIERRFGATAVTMELPVGRYRNADDVPGDVTVARGESMEDAKEPLWPELTLALHTVLDPEMRLLAELVPDLDLRLWPHFIDA